MRVVLDAFAMGADSSDSSEDAVMTGRIVDRDSGRRRVRNSVEDCRYILVIWDEPLRDDVGFERDGMEEESNWEDESVSLVGVIVVAIEASEAIFK